MDHTDPAGFIDGPNLYAYLQHQPLNGFDLYGLQEEIAPEPYYPLQNVIYHDSNENQNQPEDGAPNEAPLGFVEKKAGKKDKIFFCGSKQIAELGIGFVNGILNSLQDAYNSTKKIAEMLDDHFVTFLYNESNGFICDLIRCAAELYFHWKSPAVIELQNKLMAYFAHAGPNAMYYHICHSEGAIVTRNALEGLPDEIRQRIIVTAIAPGAYIPKNLAFRVTHYVSSRDIVPLFDFVGAYKCRETIVVLDPHPDAPFFDHPFDSPTYESLRVQRLLIIIINTEE